MKQVIERLKNSLLILNVVQSVYQSQGVSIANKHLEVIIKQMTTKF
jgi:DNA-directed RNA polymerase subunit beta'